MTINNIYEALTTNMGPNQGGCWYCHQYDNAPDLVFCCEFDTYLHLSCLEARLPPDDDDLETQIIAREFKDVL